MGREKAEGRREKGEGRRKTDSGFDQGLRIVIKDRDSGFTIRD
jgi:hypothetical protein